MLNIERDIIRGFSAVHLPSFVVQTIYHNNLFFFLIGFSNFSKNRNDFPVDSIFALILILNLLSCL